MEPDFFKIVTNRPDKKAGKECPFCKSKKIKEGSTMSTLVGGGPEANHRWTDAQCLECKKHFTIERKSGNTWITIDRGRILKGVPSCFESYIYTCSKCGGDVKRTNIDKQTGSVTGGSWQTIDGKMTKMFETIFECDSCHEKIISDQEYYHPEKS